MFSSPLSLSLISQFSSIQSGLKPICSKLGAGPNHSSKEMILPSWREYGLLSMYSDVSKDADEALDDAWMISDGALPVVVMEGEDERDELVNFDSFFSWPSRSSNASPSGVPL